MDKFYHSVRLDADLCMGCINCIKRCPTQAIRVRNGKAQINSKFCIDCGECIRVCPHHAKHATYDKLDVLKQYEYTVALPAPSLYSQFNNLDDVNIVLNALLMMGFHDVFEVSAAAELVSEATREYLSENPDRLPAISTACPSVVRLIRVRFPNLIPNLLPLNPPVEVAAILAAEKAMKETGLPREKIGIIFISDNGGYRLNILIDLRYNSINIDTAGKIDALVIPVPIFFICLSSPSSIYSSRIRAACDSIQRIDYRCYRASIDIIISSTFYRLHRKQQGAIVSYSAIGNCCILKS